MYWSELVAARLFHIVAVASVPIGYRFAIITLVYDEDAAVPGLLQSYVWRNVRNDLEGFNEVLRALPIELGAVRWKHGLR